MGNLSTRPRLRAISLLNPCRAVPLFSPNYPAGGVAVGLNTCENFHNKSSELVRALFSTSFVFPTKAKFSSVLSTCLLGLRVGCDRLKRSSIVKVIGLGVGVGGRQIEAPQAKEGGGYLDICTTFEFRRRRQPKNFFFQ